MINYDLYKFCVSNFRELLDSKLNVAKKLGDSEARIKYLNEGNCCRIHLKGNFVNKYQF